MIPGAGYPDRYTFVPEINKNCDTAVFDRPHSDKRTVSFRFWEALNIAVGNSFADLILLFLTVADAGRFEAKPR